MVFLGLASALGKPVVLLREGDEVMKVSEFGSSIVPGGDGQKCP